MTSVISDLVDFVRSSLDARANPEKAAGMQAYMKTDMPFFGVQKPGRVGILRDIKSRFAPRTHAEYLESAAALWELPHREEKYLAQGFAVAFPRHIVPDSLPLYRRFIVEGAWWDFVDETATHMIRELVMSHPEEIWPVVEGWVVGENMWLRRAAILCQVGAKTSTDSDRLFSFCTGRAHESEFFIRKAIGWALRDYARTDPDAVARFVTDHRAELSPLSVREASKHIGHLVEP
jgi:3-methyladenine DNA glycosylase AlkD